MNMNERNRKMKPEMKMSVMAVILLLAVLPSARIPAQTSADSSLLAEIFKIKAIDNHAHPLKYVAEGEKPAGCN